MPDMRVSLAGVEFDNPMIAASGTFGFGHEYGEYFDLNQLGGISVKGLTLKPRLGNPPPRIAETPSGILNSIGLQNPGVEAFIEKELPFLKQYRTKIIANIAGSTIEDYVEMAKTLTETGIDMVELNISCPNVKEGGVAFGTDERTIFEITSRVKAVLKEPLIVKLSPNVTDIKKMALAAQNGGADVLSLINTLMGMRIDTATRRPILHNNTGGLSGPAVFPVAVRMVCEVAGVVNIPIIGMGGISSGKDAIEMMMAGADAVMVGTALFPEPAVPMRILREMEAFLEEQKLQHVSDVTKTVKLWS